MLNRLTTKVALCTSFMLLLGCTQNSWNMHYAAKAYKSICFLTRWAPLVGSAAMGGMVYYATQHQKLSFPQSLEERLKRGHTPIQNEMISAHLQRIAHSRGIQNILFCSNDALLFSQMNGNVEGVIEVCPKDLQILEACLAKPQEELSRDEQEQLHRVEATMHHELTHVTRASPLRHECAKSAVTLAAFPVIEIARVCLAKYISSVHPAGWLLNTTLYGSTSIASAALGFKALPILNKLEELRADDGIPNEEYLLSAKAAYHEGCHISLRNVLEKVEQGQNDDRISPMNKFLVRSLGVKRMDRNPWMYELLGSGFGYTTHPADITRAQRLRQRIAQLKQQQNTTNKKS